MCVNGHCEKKIKTLIAFVPYANFITHVVWPYNELIYLVLTVNAGQYKSKDAQSIWIILHSPSHMHLFAMQIQLNDYTHIKQTRIESVWLMKSMHLLQPQININKAYIHIDYKAFLKSYRCSVCILVHALYFSSYTL
jgi:hypothetical protein